MPFQCPKINPSEIAEKKILAVKAPFFQEFLTKLFAYMPLLWMGFNFLRARATSRRQFTEIPGTDFTNLRRMKD